MASPESNPPGAWKMWRLKMLKNSALKSMVARSPNIRVFLPKVKSSFRPPNVRAPARDLPSLPKVRGPATVNAAGLKNGVDAGLKFEPLLVSATPWTTFTRAIPVKWQPANRTSPAVPPHGPYTAVGFPDL